MEEYFEIGQIVNTSGLKGEIKVKPFTDEFKGIEEFKNKKVFMFSDIQKISYRQQLQQPPQERHGKGCTGTACRARNQAERAQVPR